MQTGTIAEQLFFSTVRIDTEYHNGDRGSGTGFFFSMKHDGKDAAFIVTNKHVVADASMGSLSFLKRDGDSPKLGERLSLSPVNWDTAWFGHPDPTIDIAICPLASLIEHAKTNHGYDVFLRFVSADSIPTDEEEEDLDAIESVTFLDTLMAFGTLTIFFQ